MQRSKRSPEDSYVPLGIACALVVFVVALAAFLMSRGLPGYQVISFTGFGACVAALLLFALRLAIEDNRRSDHTH